MRPVLPRQPEVDLAALHDTVQQKVGRFILIAQRHEQILKALVIDSEVAGTVVTAPANMRQRKERFKGQSLGNVVVEFNRSYLREAGTSQVWVDAKVDLGGRPSFHTRFGLEMARHDLESTRQRLLDFRDLRNRVVHHLIQDHDLSRQEGCERAIAYLDAARRIAKERLEEAEGWAKTNIEARDHAIAFFQSESFWKFVMDAKQEAPAPTESPSIDWAACIALHLLRREEQLTKPGEMTNLEAALKAIQTTHPGEYPTKYGQKTWLGVLRASQMFSIKRLKGTAERPGTTWYRSLPAKLPA